MTIFDLLTKPEIKLTKAEEIEVKTVAKQLLTTLKREKLVLDWKKRQSTKAAVRYTIENGARWIAEGLHARSISAKVRRGLPAHL